MATGIISNPVPIPPPEPPQSSVWIETAEAKELIIPEQISLMGQLWGATTTSIALSIVEVESQFNPLAQNPRSTAKGLFQFLDGTWKENCVGDPLKAKDNMRCGLRLINEGQLFRWEASQDKWLPLLATSTREMILEKCQCVRYARGRGLNVKGNAEDLIPSSMPFVGGGALFKYPQGSHLAYIESIKGSGFWVSESNYRRCKITSRFVQFDDKYLIGFIR